MQDYRSAIFDDGETVVQVLTYVRDGCVLTLQIAAAVGTGGASLSAQLAAGAAVAGYSQALSEIDSASTQKGYRIETGLGRVAFAMGADALVGAIFKGAKGKEVVEAIKKRALNGSSKALAKYLTDAAASGIEGLVSDWIKGIPKLMDPSKPLTLEASPRKMRLPF